MLNEIKEFEEYQHMDIVENPRLHPLVFFGGKSNGKGSTRIGIERALFVLARGYYYGVGAISARDVSATKEALNDWLSTVFRNYYDNILASGKISDCPSTEKMLSHILANYNKSIWDEFDSTQKHNTAKYITLDGIIASAIDAGKLKEYGLLYPQNYISNENLLYNGNAITGKYQEKRRDFLLKTLSAYLLEKNRSNTQYVVYNNADIANWMQDPKLVKDPNAQFKAYTYKNKPMVLKTSRANLTLLCFNQDFLNDFNFQLVNPEFTPPKDYLVYRD